MSVDRESGMVMESVIFRAGLIEISVTEPHHRNNGIINVQTLVFDPHHRQLVEIWDVFMETLVTLVEAAQIVLRNPPDEL